MKSLVSKENVVPSREGSETQKFAIKRVGKDQISPEKKIFVRTKGWKVIILRWKCDPLLGGGGEGGIRPMTDGVRSVSFFLTFYFWENAASLIYY